MSERPYRSQQTDPDLIELELVEAESEPELEQPARPLPAPRPHRPIRRKVTDTWPGRP